MHNFTLINFIKTELFFLILQLYYEESIDEFRTEFHLTDDFFNFYL